MFSTFRNTALAAIIAGLGLLPAGGAKAAPSLCNAIAGNLVTNCGFEATIGNEAAGFPGWTATPGSNAAFGVDTINPHSGNNAALFESLTSADTISQTLATKPGTLYDFSFFVADAGSGSELRDFKASLDGMVVFGWGRPLGRRPPMQHASVEIV